MGPLGNSARQADKRCLALAMLLQNVHSHTQRQNTCTSPQPSQQVPDNFISGLVGKPD